MFSILFIGVVNCIFLTGCNNEKNFESENMAGETVKYYTTFKHYDVPFKFMGEITKEKALSLKKASYYIGYYNNNKQLTMAKNVLNSKIVWTVIYEYYNNGKLKQSKITHADGSIRINKYDQNGKLLE